MTIAVQRAELDALVKDRSFAGREEMCQALLV